MYLTSARLRDFRSYERAEVEFEPGLNLVLGDNGVGKTNLIEAVYFGCVGRSFRTAEDRTMIRRGGDLARVELGVAGAHREQSLAASLSRSGERTFAHNGEHVASLRDIEDRPRMAVFEPDRMALIKGAPALRRAHLDQLVATLWPQRAQTRLDYQRVLAQRNALLLQAQHGFQDTEQFNAWELELAVLGSSLSSAREELVENLREPLLTAFELLGAKEQVSLGYRRSIDVTAVEEIAAQFAAERQREIVRGRTQRGAHRDELTVKQGGVELRRYGSQGQQRTALLALLLAERELIGAQRGAAPVLLLDDVMSELDHNRRARLADYLRDGGQAVISATSNVLIPGFESDHLLEVASSHGSSEIAA